MTSTHLYRYLNLDNQYHFNELEDLCKNGNLTLKQARCVNDYFDFFPDYEYPKNLKDKERRVRTSLNNLGNKNKNFNSDLNFKKLNEKVSEAMKKENYYCSFSECFSDDINSLLMWSHYSNNHTGVCIKMSFLSSELLGKYHMIDKVAYNNDRPVISDKNNAQENIKKTFFYKANCWEYEKEHRLIESFDFINNKTNSLSTHKKIKLGKLEGIYFGLNCSQDNITKIRKFAPEEVSLYKAKDVPKKFSINFKRI